jgi:hypothetical protein
MDGHPLDNAEEIEDIKNRLHRIGVKFELFDDVDQA